MICYKVPNYLNKFVHSHENDQQNTNKVTFQLKVLSN